MVILTILSVATLVGLADGIQREFNRRLEQDGVRAEQERRDDLFRRGFIL